jgi:hypothetical protein
MRGHERRKDSEVTSELELAARELLATMESPRTRKASDAWDRLRAIVYSRAPCGSIRDALERFAIERLGETTETALGLPYDALGAFARDLAANPEAMAQLARVAANPEPVTLREYARLHGWSVIHVPKSLHSQPGISRAKVKNDRVANAAGYRGILGMFQDYATEEDAWQAIERRLKHEGVQRG